MANYFYRGSSFYDGKYILDSEILQYVGVKNYSMLQKMYPNYFEFYPDCDIKNKEFIVPDINNLIIDHSPEKIKQDIIETILYKKHVSNNSFLVISKNPLNFKLKDDNCEISKWIIICLCFVILFFIAFYYIFTLKITNEIFTNFSNYNHNLNEKKIKKIIKWDSPQMEN